MILITYKSMIELLYGCSATIQQFCYCMNTQIKQLNYISTIEFNFIASIKFVSYQ